MCLFLMSILNCFYYYISIVEFDVRVDDTAGSSFTIQNCLGCLGFLFFHKKLSTVLSRSVKKCIGSMGIALNL